MSSQYHPSINRRVIKKRPLNTIVRECTKLDITATPFIADKSQNEKGKSKLLTDNERKLKKERVTDKVFRGKYEESFHP